ncbi:MAG: DUF5916 domain-containing protein [Gemmatimonadaceae bacterium]
MPNAARSILLLVTVFSASRSTARAQSVFDPSPSPPVIRAQRAAGSLKIDGRLDDVAWQNALMATGFIQSEPNQGDSTRFHTHVRIVFDEHYLYLGAVLHDSAGRAGVRVPDLRRDFGDDNNDLFGVVFDTFRDGRSAVAFVTNPYGAQRDLIAFDDQGRLTDVSWDAVWDVRTVLGDSGWTAEMAIPWATLRYPAASSVWGINFIRIARRANETSGWSPWPRAYSSLRVRYAGRVTGLEPPPPAANVRVQPYAVASAERLERTTAGTSRDTRPDIGADVKWAITPSTVLDATVNTDFAQADADIQQVNLGRFSLFFPEKRPFFLENSGLFAVGGAGFGGEPFFTRRIGLDDAGSPVPIDAGVRLTSRTPTQSLGLLGVRQQQGAERPASTFGVGRYVRNVGLENRIGAMLVSRMDDETRDDAVATNTVAAVDGFVRPSRSSYVRAMLARSFTSGGGGDGTHGYVHAAMNANYGYFGWVQSYISRDYRADVGFVPRGDLILTSPAVTLDWRPSWRPTSVRAFNPGFSTAIYHRASDRRFQEASVTLNPVQWTFQDGGSLRIWSRPEWQHLERSFTPVPQMPIDSGDYQFTQYGVTYRPDLSRSLWAWVTVASGGYYDGTRDQAIVRIRTAPSPHVAVTFDYEGNRLRDVGRDNASRSTHLFYPELRLALNPRVQFVTLWQYSSVSRIEGWNARIAWEFRPLSYVYLVYSDRVFRDAAGVVRPEIAAERRLILKVSWLRQL